MPKVIENPTLEELDHLEKDRDDRPGVTENSDGAVKLPKIKTAADMYKGQCRELPMLLESMLWTGLTMFVARPKAGKSWLTLQIAVQIAGGPPIEGVKATVDGPVLYVALEEPEARTISRLRKIAPNGDWASRLHMVYELLPLMSGGSEQLAGLIKGVEPRVVIIDTLAAAVKVGPKSGSKVFLSEYAEISCLRKLCEQFNIAIILVHHTRKASRSSYPGNPSEDAIDSVSGTSGTSAGADTIWALRVKPEGEATLEIVGRETENRTLALRFEQQPIGWKVLGDDARQLVNAERRELLDLLHEDGALTPAQIAAGLGKSQPAARMLLKRMRRDGLVEKQGSKYTPTHTVRYGVTE